MIMKYYKKYDILRSILNGDSIKNISLKTKRAYLWIYIRIHQYALLGLVELKYGHKCNKRLKVYVTEKGKNLLLQQQIYIKRFINNKTLIVNR